MSSSALIRGFIPSPQAPAALMDHNVLQGCVHPAFHGHLKPFTLPTSHGRLHGSFHHPHQELEAFGVLSQPRCKGGQGICVASQVLEGNTLSEVCLETQGRRQGYKVPVGFLITDTGETPVAQNRIDAW